MGYVILPKEGYITSTLLPNFRFSVSWPLPFKKPNDPTSGLWLKPQNHNEIFPPKLRIQFFCQTSRNSVKRLPRHIHDKLYHHVSSLELWTGAMGFLHQGFKLGTLRCGGCKMLKLQFKVCFVRRDAVRTKLTCLAAHLLLRSDLWYTLQLQDRIRCLQISPVQKFYGKSKIHAVNQVDY